MLGPEPRLVTAAVFCQCIKIKFYPRNEGSKAELSHGVCAPAHSTIPLRSNANTHTHTHTDTLQDRLGTNTCGSKRTIARCDASSEVILDPTNFPHEPFWSSEKLTMCRGRGWRLRRICAKHAQIGPDDTTDRQMTLDGAGVGVGGPSTSVYVRVYARLTGGNKRKKR